MEVIVTKANVHDSKAAFRLVFNLLDDNSAVRLIKADMGYRGALKKALCSAFPARMD